MAKQVKINRTKLHKVNVRSNGSSKEKTLTNEELLALLQKVKDKDYDVQFPTHQKGTLGAIYKTLNDIVDRNAKLTRQVELSGKNAKEVVEAQRSLEEKARQLALTSKYKSEFLANMSHELRTPLNSLQILAREFIDNTEGNLSEKQIQYAKTINTCGEELIELINDILDLSKIESGYLHIESEPITFKEISEYIENAFKLTSESKHLAYSVEIGEGLPNFINTDYQRLNQILKNLLSNAFKFTEKGHVKFRIYKATRNWKTRSPYLDKAESVIGFEVTDTGIGIPEDKQKIVFEAFQQAEGSTSRKYGGTGLGLPISRGLADLLGGIIELESIMGVGSKFTLFLPIEIPKAIREKQVKARNKIKPKPHVRTFHPKEIDEKVKEFSQMVNDDRERIGANDKVLFLIDNDIDFVKLFIDKAHKNRIKVVAATKGSDVIEYLNQYHPTAIIKDISPSDTKGWKVFERLKNDLLTRHIPIYVTAVQNDKNVALKCGARNFLVKPMTEAKFQQLFNDILEFGNKRTRSILVVDNTNEWINEVVDAIEYKDVEMSAAKSAKEAIELIGKKDPDCILMDLVSVPEERSQIITALEEMGIKKEVTIITYSSIDISNSERARLSKFNIHYIKRDISSIDQLVDLVSITLHRNFKDLPTEMKKRIENFSRREDILSGKKILIVDDDVRNLFAMSVGLERYGLSILTCESGQDALNILNQTAGIDIVLMDIMMPEMDGYETMRRIRAQTEHKDLTIIAVTAKAMQGDRQKCIESGASDYITKPVNVDQLVSLMRVWLKQKHQKRYQDVV